MKKLGGLSVRPLLSSAIRIGRKVLLVLLLVWVGAVVVFSFLPVPYSTVMMQRQLAAWLSGDFSYVARQSWVSMDEISPHMALAVIAGEDQGFPDHWGFDVDAIASVLADNGENLDRARGASTISQQMTKNLFLWSGRSWIRKGLETGMTAGIELLWSKRRILTVYLNIVEFGSGVFGVEQAAQRFFKKPAEKLSPSEAALLAAVLPNPHRFRADAPSRYVLQRQQWILRQMNQLGGAQFLEKL